MSRIQPFLLLILCIATAACTRGRWSTSYDSETLPNGKLYTLAFASPADSGLVATAVIEADSTVQCGGRENRNYFPPRRVFDLKVWCEGSPDTLAYQYDGEAETVRYDEQEFDLSASPLLVAVMRPSGSTLYHLPQEDLVLSPETKQELKERFPQAFRQD